MEEENTQEVPRRKRKVVHRPIDREDDGQNVEERPTEMDPDAANVISNIDEHYRTEILRLEDEMVSFFKCSSKSPTYAVLPQRTNNLS